MTDPHSHVSLAEHMIYCGHSYTFTRRMHLYYTHAFVNDSTMNV